MSGRDEVTAIKEAIEYISAYDFSDSVDESLKDHPEFTQEKLLIEKLTAAAKRVEGLEGERNMVSERMEELVSVALAAARDIAEWQQLARYQREKSINPNHDPLCATEAAIETSEQIKKDLYRAAFGQDATTALSAKGEGANE